MAEKEYLTQQAKEEAGKNLTYYTADWDSKKAEREAKGQQQQIDAAVRRGERTEIIEGARRGAQKTLTNSENTRIRAENERRQREYEAAVQREQERYQREMKAYKIAVASEEAKYQRQLAAYNKAIQEQRQNQQRRAQNALKAQQNRAARIKQIKNKDPIRKLGKKIAKIFGW